MIEIEDRIKNVQNEILFVGAIYKQPDLLVEYGFFVKSDYDFFDPVTKFLYNQSETIFQKRTQNFTQDIINLYMSENKERFDLYKKYGGWKTIESWMEIASVDDFKNYFDVLKKYSLLREYHRKGHNVEKILDHKKFNLFSADDIYKLVRSQVDRIKTVIMKNNDIEILNDGLVNMINGCLEKPDMGLDLPFPIFNDLIRGARTKSMFVTGMTSNSGKSRYMFRIIAYFALILKKKVLVLLNEMSIDDMKYCLLVTCINNKEFKLIHGINISKKEREIALGMYKNDKGEFIYREKDDGGNYTENINDFVKRLEENSSEYVQIKKLAEWIENETNGLIYAKDVSTDYSDKTLEFEIRKANLIQNIQYVFYDTLKNPVSALGDWASLQGTTTKLKELATQLNIFVYGSIQLTADANVIQPLELSAMNIASCKNLKHIVDGLAMFKEIDREDYYKYYYCDTNNYDPAWGTIDEKSLDLNKRMYAMILDKNRAGARKDLLFDVNLDENRWEELGELFKK